MQHLSFKNGKCHMDVIFEPYSARIMKMKLLIVGAFLMLGGCAAQPASFSWYHPEGGEFLFAYDSNECATTVTAAGRELGSDIDGPFFQCMHARGYYLVDANGIVQEPVVTTFSEGPQVSQQ